MVVEVIGVKQIPPKKGDKESEYSVTKSKNQALLDTLKAIYGILAVRAMLFISLLGSFLLSLIAIHDKDSASLWVLIAYSFLTTGPLVLLEWRGKRNGG